MSGISFREAILDDVERISTLILVSQDEFCFHEYTEDGKNLMRRLCGIDAIRSYVERGDIYYVAEFEERLIGVAGMRDREHLSHNFVARAWHRRGISNQLWRFVSDECERQGNDGSFSLNASTYAIPVYEKWGFEIVGPINHAYGLAFTPMELKAK